MLIDIIENSVAGKYFNRLPNDLLVICRERGYSVLLSLILNYLQWYYWIACKQAESVAEKLSS